MYTDELILDISIGAFNKNKFVEFESDSPYAVDYVLAPTLTEIINDENVISESSDEVLSESLDNVVISDRTTEKTLSRLRYLTYFDPSITVSLFRNTEFKDWVSADSVGEDAPAFLLTGYEILGEAAKKQQSPYITVHMTQTEQTYTTFGATIIPDNQSGCLMQSQWDFADSATSNKFGPQQQVYRLLRAYTPDLEEVYDYGQSVVSTKNKVRGRGRALSLLFSTEEGKDCKILGWEVKFTENSNV